MVASQFRPVPLIDMAPQELPGLTYTDRRFGSHPTVAEV
jgi:hypothetical protein